MSGSVEPAKDAAKEGAEASVKKPSKSAPKSSAAEAKTSPQEQLKQAVESKDESKAPAAAAAKAKPFTATQTARYAAVATVALVVGTALGMVAAPKPRSAERFANIEASLESGRAEAARLNGEIEGIGKSLASLRDAGELARSDNRLLGGTLTERLAKIEQTIDRKFAGLAETIERIEREQAARIAGLAAQGEKRVASPQPVAPAPVAQPAPRPDPIQTGSIGEVKPKAETIESWALREVYGGIAMLEDRKRRLLEVGPGDSVPGIGRVETIERRGRAWVVVTKQGLITPQSW